MRSYQHGIQIYWTARPFSVFITVVKLLRSKWSWAFTLTSERFAATFSFSLPMLDAWRLKAAESMYNTWHATTKTSPLNNATHWITLSEIYACITSDIKCAIMAHWCHLVCHVRSSAETLIKQRPQNSNLCILNQQARVYSAVSSSEKCGQLSAAFMTFQYEF